MDKKPQKWCQCCFVVPAFLGAGCLGAIIGAVLGGMALALAAVGLIRRRSSIG